MKIRCGDIEPTIKALDSLSGECPVSLSFRIAKLRNELSDLHEVWREKHLNPAIRAWNEKGVVEAGEIASFVSAHSGIFEQEVELAVDPLKATDLPETMTIPPQALATLLKAQLIIE